MLPILRLKSILLILSLITLPCNATAYLSESVDSDNIKIQTCVTAICSTMPNSKDLLGLQVRQVVGTNRQLILYSRSTTFICSLIDGIKRKSVRVIESRLPILTSIDTNGAIKVTCSDEKSLKQFTFFIPPLEYVPHIER